jgi:hypothetical protein
MTVYHSAGAFLMDAVDKVTKEFSGKHRIKSKTALKRLLAESPADVLFDVFDINHTGPREYRASEIPDGVAFQVAGPDPETSRVWYASVSLVNGVPKITA